MPSFQETKDFLMSWSLFPTNDHTSSEECVTDELIDQGINQLCFYKMLHEAEALYGNDFAHFCSLQCNATDCWFYLRAETWESVEKAYKKAFP